MPWTRRQTEKIIRDAAAEREKEFVDALTTTAAESHISGQQRAVRQIPGASLDFRLMNTLAVRATKPYREELIRFGGSDVPVRQRDGTWKQEFKPWLWDATEEVRQRVGDIIQNAVAEGKSRRDVAREIDEYTSELDKNADLIAFNEIKKNFVQGERDRYQEEGIQSRVWRHLDPQVNPREEHIALDGQEFSIDDPVWTELLEPYCHCWDEPVIEYAAVEHGGPGSGNFGHAGRPGEVGGSGEGGTPAERSERARASYKPVTMEKRAIARENEHRTARALNGQKTGGNTPFDVIRGQVAIEIKTIIRGTNDKITMHPDSRQRKLDSARKAGLKPFTVVFDARGSGSPAIYYKEGVGSFRLGSMQRVDSLAELGGKIK
jgi:SPP1 gp7 family putative phage head morphogenesis protein